jgi:hypothetical protein
MITLPTRQRRRRKPAKPYHAFPLTAHNNGQWCKKIHRKVRFFGTWAEPEAALQRYLKMAADLHAGREPNQSVPPDAPTVKEVCNHYLTYQLRRSQVGEIGPRWFEDCRTVLETLPRSSRMGNPSELLPRRLSRASSEASTRWPDRQEETGRLCLDARHHRSSGLFKYAYKMNLIDRQIKYGKAFECTSSAAEGNRPRQSETDPVAVRLASGEEGIGGYGTAPPATAGRARWGRPTGPLPSR